MPWDDTRGLACEQCIKGWYQGKLGTDLYQHRASLIALQRDLYTCSQCGTWWDYPPLSRPHVITEHEAQAMIGGTWKP